MLRAGLTLLRRLVCAASLLILLICGAEVGVRVYEAATGKRVCPLKVTESRDPSMLTVPSWSFLNELKPLASAKVGCRDSGKEIEIHTNSLGLRGAEPMIPKPAQVFRIVVLGDETVYAPETADDDHFCHLLETGMQRRANSRIEVINAGIPGHCPLTEYLLFKQRLLALQPDLVLMHFDWSDVADDVIVRRGSLRGKTGSWQTCPHPKLANEKKERPQEVWRQQFRLLDWGLSTISLEWKQQVARQAAISREVETNPYAWLRDEHPEKNRAFRKAVGPIVELARLCHASHIEFALVTSPKPWQVSAKCSRGEGVRLAAGVAQEACFQNRAPFEVFTRFAELNRIPVLDTSNDFSTGRDTETNFLKYAPRWSAIGHRRMANLIVQFLTETLPGTWNSPDMEQNEQTITLSRANDTLSASQPARVQQTRHDESRSLSGLR